MAKSTTPPKKTAVKKETTPRQQPDTASSDLDELFINSVKDLYWAENHLVANLPKVRDAAGNPALKRAIADHLKVTKGHVTRLEEIFGLLGQAALARKCDAMEGLVMSGEAVINTTTTGSAARDTGLIMACQQVEHFEIASYRGLQKLAIKLGKEKIAELLYATLTEEEESDNILSTLAERG